MAAQTAENLGSCSWWLTPKCDRSSSSLRKMSKRLLNKIAKGATTHDWSGQMVDLGRSVLAGFLEAWETYMGRIQKSNVKNTMADFPFKTTRWHCNTGEDHFLESKKPMCLRPQKWNCCSDLFCEKLRSFNKKQYSCKCNGMAGFRGTRLLIEGLYTPACMLPIFAKAPCCLELFGCCCCCCWDIAGCLFLRLLM